MNRNAHEHESPHPEIGRLLDQAVPPLREPADRLGAVRARVHRARRRNGAALTGGVAALVALALVVPQLLGGPSPDGSADTPGPAAASPADRPTTTDVGAARARWQRAGFTDYSYQLDAGCGECGLIGRFQVTVRDGEVVDAEPLSPYGRDRIAELSPTIDEIWERIDDARDQDPYRIALEFDAEYGYPTLVDVDYARNAVDDTFQYEINEFSPTP